MRKARWKSISPAKMSASCTATLSGIFASSVAANKELWMVPLPKRWFTCRGAVSSCSVKVSPARVTTQRLNWSEPSMAQRTVMRLSWWSALVSTLTKRAARPSRFWRATPDVRKKLAACESLTPRRLSRLSAVSLVRLRSERNKSKALSVELLVCVRAVTVSSTERTGVLSRAASKPAMAKAPPPANDKTRAVTAIACLGCVL